MPSSLIAAAAPDSPCPLVAVQTHGYDNEEPAMHALFVAHGPFASAVRTSAHVHSRVPGSPHGVCVLETFENVQIYSLVMKLLGIEAYAAPTNGSRVFWDQTLC